jgi:hypothetical protein
MQPKVEAIFIAADAPAEAASFIASGFGATTEPAADGQQIISGLGVYIVIEPSTVAKPRGTVTLWVRTDDAREKHAQLVDLGCKSIDEAADSGKETVASLRTPHGLRVGLISGGL